MSATRSIAVLLSMACVTAFAASPASELPPGERFVSQLSVKDGHLAWQHVRPGMSQREVEERLGKLTPKRSESGHGAYTHYVVVVRDGVSVQLGFYIASGHRILTEIALSTSDLTKSQVAALRKAAKVRLKGMRDSGPDFPLAAPGGEELDIETGVVRVQIGSDSE